MYIQSGWLASYLSSGQVGRKGSSFTLRVPAVDPLIGTERVVGLEELPAGLELLASHVDALVVVDVVLPAVLAL